jgi:hypothetical protein
MEKKTHPKMKHLILNKTVRKICNFFDMDYLLFDFEMPSVCKYSDDDDAEPSDDGEGKSNNIKI